MQLKTQKILHFEKQLEAVVLNGHSKIIGSVLLPQCIHGSPGRINRSQGINYGYTKLRTE